jgi:hypothetical protein
MGKLCMYVNIKNMLGYKRFVCRWNYLMIVWIENKKMVVNMKEKDWL